MTPNPSPSAVTGGVTQELVERCWKAANDQIDDVDQYCTETMMRAALAVAVEAISSQAQPAKGADIDPECICRGNWRAIVKETEHLFGKTFTDGKHEYAFFGVVHSDDDYYYGMRRLGKDGYALQLLSCVGSIEGHGWVLSATHADEGGNLTGF